MALDIEPRDKVCGTCGFLNDSKKGVLNNHTSGRFIDYVEKPMVFPCHEELQKITGIENKGVEQLIAYYKIIDKPLLVCRGFIESIEKDNKYINPLFEYLIKKLKKKQTKNIMTIDETMEYHNIER